MGTGIIPRVAKVGPACAIMISTYEYGKYRHIICCAARPLQGSLILRVVVLLHAGKEFFRRQNYMDELQ